MNRQHRLDLGAAEPHLKERATRSGARPSWAVAMAALRLPAVRKRSDFHASLAHASDAIHRRAMRHRAGG